MYDLISRAIIRASGRRPTDKKTTFMGVLLVGVRPKYRVVTVLSARMTATWHLHADIRNTMIVVVA